MILTTWPAPAIRRPPGSAVGDSRARTGRGLPQTSRRQQADSGPSTRQRRPGKFLRISRAVASYRQDRTGISADVRVRSLQWIQHEKTAAVTASLSSLDVSAKDVDRAVQEAAQEVS